MNWQCVVLCLMITGLEGSFFIQKLNQEGHVYDKKSYASTRNDIKKQNTAMASKYKYNRSSVSANRAISKHYKAPKSSHKNVFARSQYPPTADFKKTPKSITSKPARNFSFSYLKGLQSTVSKAPKSSTYQNPKPLGSTRTSKPFSFISYCASKSRSSVAAPKSKPKSTAEIESFVYTALTPNQWTEFYFVEPDQLPFSRWSFSIAPTKICSLQLVDSFCTGDRFTAIRLLPTGLQIPLLTTPPVPYNPRIAASILSGKNDTCEPFTTDPAIAWNSSAWSKGQTKLSSGDYKLIIKSVIAPYGSGGAFLRLVCQ